MPFCESCGRAITNTDRFCTNCGSPVKRTDSGSLQWKYVKPIKDDNAVSAFEQEYGFALPADFKHMLPEINGGRPDKKCFATKTGCERLIKSVLSFNRDDRETVWMFNEDDSEEEALKDLMVFALDDFGNPICFDRSGRVLFYDHEDEETEFVSDSFTEFLKCLYE